MTYKCENSQKTSWPFKCEKIFLHQTNQCSSGMRSHTSLNAKVIRKRTQDASEMWEDMKAACSQNPKVGCSHGLIIMWVDYETKSVGFLLRAGCDVSCRGENLPSWSLKASILPIHSPTVGLSNKYVTGKTVSGRLLFLLYPVYVKACV